MNYPFVFYIDWPIPSDASGVARGPFCFIRPKYKYDVGLREHEILHALDWWRFTAVGLLLVWIIDSSINPVAGLTLFPYFLTTWIYGSLYTFVAEFRLWAEVRCYAKQAHFYTDDRRPLFANLIATGYELDVSEVEALELLRRAT